VVPLINGELDRLILENHIEHIESINSQIKKTRSDKGESLPGRGRPPAAQPHWNRYVHSPVDKVGDRTVKVPRLQEANGLGSPHPRTSQALLSTTAGSRSRDRGFSASP
jgi:hypothetical protein